MPTRWQWAVIIGAASVVVAPVATPAQTSPRVTIELTPPDTLGVGDRATVTAEVTIVPSGDEPLLLTPNTEGTAVEVVRGRLVRGDAEDPAAETLRFRIPVVARTPGTGVLRVAVSGYACTERCRRATGEASIVLRVQRRDPEPPAD